MRKIQFQLLLCNSWAIFLQVIHDESDIEPGIKQDEMPLLVYVSREKRPSHSHHFKAGALNVLVLLCSTSVSFCHILPPLQVHFRVLF